MSTIDFVKPAPDSVWIIGKAISTELVMLDGKACQPHMFVVMERGGLIRAFSAGRADHGKALLREALSMAETSPMAGVPGRPNQVIVGHEDLADQVRSARPGIEVLVHPTPEMDELLLELSQSLGRNGEESESCPPGGVFKPEILESHKASWYRAAADMYARAPWMLLSENRTLLRLAAPAAGIEELVVCMIGELGESLGFLVFHSSEDFGRYCELAEHVDRNEVPPLDQMPDHYALNYIRLSDLPAADRKRFKKARHALADADAYPELLHIGPMMNSMPVGIEDLRMAELTCRTISWLMDNEPRLADTDMDLEGLHHEVNMELNRQSIPVIVTFL